MTFTGRLAASVLLIGMLGSTAALAAPGGCSGSGNGGLLLESGGVQSILNEMKTDMQKNLNRAKFALVAVAGLQIVLAAIGFMLFDRPLWSGFTYPIAAAVMLQLYEPLVKNLVAVPQEIGWDMANQALIKALDSVQKSANDWLNSADDGISIFSPLRTVLWAIVIKGVMFLSLIFSILAFALLEIAQVATLSILYVLGPFFCLAAAFRPTMQFAVRWATMVVQVSAWTVVWGVLLNAILQIDCALPQMPPPSEWFDPAYMVNLFQRIALFFLFGLLTLAAPAISGMLIGSGSAGIIAGAAAGALAKGGDMFKSGAKGAAEGAAVGGPAGAVVGAASDLALSVTTDAMRDAAAAAAGPSDQGGRAADYQGQLDAMGGHQMGEGVGGGSDAGGGGGGPSGGGAAGGGAADAALAA